MLSIRPRLFVCTTLSILVCEVAWAEAQVKVDTRKSKAGVAAYVGGKAITMQDVDAKALRKDIKLAQSLYEARREALDRIILERLLGREATARATTIDKLILARIAEKTKPVRDEDVEAFYNANRDRLRNRTLEQVSGQIRTHLTTTRADEARESLLKQLKKTTDLRIILEPPRVDVVIAADDPVRGPAKAKVTIVEYSDFQ